MFLITLKYRFIIKFYREKSYKQVVQQFYNNVTNCCILLSFRHALREFVPTISRLSLACMSRIIANKTATLRTATSVMPYKTQWITKNLSRGLENGKRKYINEQKSFCSYFLNQSQDKSNESSIALVLNANFGNMWKEYRSLNTGNIRAAKCYKVGGLIKEKLYRAYTKEWRSLKS